MRRPSSRAAHLPAVAVYLIEHAGVGVRREQPPEREDDSYWKASSLMLRAFGLSNIGCVRRNNEDVFKLADDIGLYMVADGMGGAQAGEVAASLATESVVDYFRQNSGKELSALCQAFGRAHSNVLTVAAHDSALSGMGSTLVAALCDQDAVCLANVGDSRAYVFNREGCQYMSVDQTWVNEMGRNLGLSATQLKGHPWRHVLTVAVGSEGHFRVNSVKLPLNADTRILLCTDGLHDVVSDSEIAEIMMGSHPPDWKCHLMVEAARKAGGPDNITVIVLQNDDPPARG